MTESDIYIYIGQRKISWGGDKGDLEKNSKREDRGEKREDREERNKEEKQERERNRTKN